MQSDARPISATITFFVGLIGVLTLVAAASPFVFTAGNGPVEHLAVTGKLIKLYGYGPYRNMPADVAVQGLAQDAVTLCLGVPTLFAALWMARRGARLGYLLLVGSIGYLFVQYVLYLAMATYNELFLLWVVLVLLLFQILLRLLASGGQEVSGWPSPPNGVRPYVGGFLIVNGALIALLWLSVIVPPLVSGSLYPDGLAHLTTMVVQGFDLAIFLPVSLVAGYGYLRGTSAGRLLAPAYAVFLTLQMTALLAKIGWMATVGVSAGPALLIVPVLLAGSLAAASLALAAVSPKRSV
ncbi:MAG TPA: hypothetical protein VGV07_12995 [Devosia sp.]|uniref:hypothetical protein n=1 Tax=Devosia sp. TaxID=1871048 RepID=UPI002DDD6472|nr:hypothetical protein [Devosia sp.]HEV2516163.1 hypothetical protein [Devosia sp.]